MFSKIRKQLHSWRVCVAMGVRRFCSFAPLIVQSKHTIECTQNPNKRHGPTKLCCTTQMCLSLIGKVQFGLYKHQKPNVDTSVRVSLFTLEIKNVDESSFSAKRKRKIKRSISMLSKIYYFINTSKNLFKLYHNLYQLSHF